MTVVNLVICPACEATQQEGVNEECPNCGDGTLVHCFYVEEGSISDKQMDQIKEILEVEEVP
jgi:uncharacterized protein (DUF983 family)